MGLPFGSVRKVGGISSFGGMSCQPFFSGLTVFKKLPDQLKTSLFLHAERFRHGGNNGVAVKLNVFHREIKTWMLARGQVKSLKYSIFTILQVVSADV